MATWVGTFVNNLDGNSVRELEVEADDEVTAMMLLDLYDYDETWQHYSFVDMHKQEVRDIAARNNCCQKDLKKPVCVPLVHADIKTIFTTLICAHCFSGFCLYNSPFSHGQYTEFNRTEVQVQCKNWTPSKPKYGLYQRGLRGLAIAN